MPAQTVSWTTLPNGRDGDLLRFSVHVAPRLRTTPAAEGILGDFPDWVDWPATLAGVTFTLHFPDTGWPPLGVQPLPLFQSARWTDLFPPSTLVRGHQFSGFACTPIHSYPTAHVVGFLEEQYGKFGASYPEAFPPYEGLVGDDAFGPIGFEDLATEHSGVPPAATGPARREALRSALTAGFNTDCDDPASSPDTWALPFLPGANQTPTEIGSNFLQVQRFLRREVPGSHTEPLPELEVPEFDLHELIAFTREYPQLGRLLGLVLDFEVPAPALAGSLDTRVRVEVDWTPQLANATPPDVIPSTHCTIGPGVFAARPRAGGDLDGRMLRIGDPEAFDLVLVDADGAAVTAMQFADNVTRSRIAITPTTRRKRSLSTPGSYALPALRTGGLAVTRRGRANLLAHTNQHVVALDASMYSPTGDPAGTGTDLYLDDLTRGYRWDALDVADGTWRSLMLRAGKYSFLDTSHQEIQAVPVTEEATRVTAVTTAGGAGAPNDLYLPESMARWRGWSLGARQFGKVLENGAFVEPENTSEDVRFAALFDVAPGSLPRLRFGREYRFRARAVDIAGNSLDPSEDDIAVDATVTETVKFRRFEPVEAPRMLLRHRAGRGAWATYQGDPGAGSEWVVIRSESAADPAATTSQRHVVPPRSGQQMAEWHGKFDLAEPGRPLDKIAYQDIADREAASLDNLGEPQTIGSTTSFFFDMDEVPIEYLTDPLAKRAFLRDLPPNPGVPHPTEASVVFEDPDDPEQTWPKRRGFRLVLQGGPTGTWAYDPTQRTLTVTVGQADIHPVPVSCQFDRTDTDIMGLWPWLEGWAAAHGVSRSHLYTLIGEGRHWMFTPSRTVTLVHAVRTPLKDPVFVDLSPDKTGVGATAAVFQSFYAPPDHVKNVLECSRKSTSKLEIVGSWRMPVDRGPDPSAPTPAVVEGSADDPTILREFSRPAFTIPIDREGGDPPGTDVVLVDAVQEFGDTKYRSVVYDCQATSAFTEYFREEIEVTLEDSLPQTTPFAYEPTTVKLKDPAETGRAYTIAPERGPFAQQPQLLTTLLNASPAVADYILDDTTRDLRRTVHGSAPNGDAVAFTFVRPQIHTQAQPVIRPVLNSARPVAPDVAYIVPAFAWDSTSPGPGGAFRSTRQGGYLRVYLRRPWWSSGDDERLGVVLWAGNHQGEPVDDPIPAMRPFVTMWGFDPVTRSGGVPVRPRPSCFPLARDIGLGHTLDEVPDRPFDVAGHAVGFDFERGLWYSDVQVTNETQTELASYFPFIRLALARYQPNSLLHCHLSRVVLADFIQLAPSRSATITGFGTSRTVTVMGHSYLRNAASEPGWGPHTSEMRVYTEEAREGIPDEHLRWERKPGHVLLTATASQPDLPTYFTWTGNVPVPGIHDKPTRLVLEEVELHYRETVPPTNPLPGSHPRPTGERVVHTDVLPLS